MTAGKPDLAALVDLLELDPNGLTNLEDIMRLVGAIVAHLRKRNEPFGATDVDESTKRDW